MVLTVRKNSLGIILCFFLALPAWFLGQTFSLVGAPVFAILMGMIAGSFLPQSERVRPGIAFTSKYVLQFAVVLLGFGLNLTQVLQVGTQSLPIIISTIATALLVAFILQKRLSLDSNTSILVGVGSSICGGSAIAATAPVIKAKDDEIAKSISVIFLFNILAALIFPTLGDIISLSNHGFSLFAGTAVNDTSSVTATATAWDVIHGSNTLETATVVKLTRTLAIIPITLALSLYQAYKASSGNGRAGQQTFSFKRSFPMFILYFLLASLITTIAASVGLNISFFDYLKIFSKFFIVMAMAAIGLNTNLTKLIKTGGQAILLGGCCWLAITAVSLFMQYLLGTW